MYLSFLVLMLALFAPGILDYSSFFDLVSGSHCLGVWVLPWSLDFSGDSGDWGLVCAQYLVRLWLHVLRSTRRVGRISHSFFVAVDLNPEVFHLRSHAEHFTSTADGGTAGGSAHDRVSH